MDKKTVGIVGATGYGGIELIRLIQRHPRLDLAYVAADKSAGQRLSTLMPWIDKKDDHFIEKWNPVKPPQVDLLFLSLPSGESRAAIVGVGPATKIIDLGGDHRFANGWTYGLADVWPDDIRGSSKVANPGCYSTAALTALAPLMKMTYDTEETIIIDAKSGVSGAGRGGGSDSLFGFAGMNESVTPYKLTGHPHVREIQCSLVELLQKYAAPIVFTPHLVPMTRGILTTCYVRCIQSAEECLADARSFYKDRPFVRVLDTPPQTKCATGSNLVFIHYACNVEAGIITAMAVIDNLGKGAAGQAVQNANLMFDFEVTLGLEGYPLYP